ncbi:recombinase family protein [Paenibacillus sp. FSL R5-0475]|uniref:recombinase family protein n=1 Tax=Paenibacillus sp. FSL R5-0475 TaxID=2921643 RepID=UPI0030F898D6
MKKIALYIRVSTDEQALKGNSLNEQEERLRAYCHAMELEGQIETFVDDGYSAGSMKRPALTRMLKMARNKELNMVVITKIDRLCRNLKDLLTLVDELDEIQCGFASAGERFDTSTAAGRMVLQILGAFAEFERGRNRERVRENLMSIVTNTDKAVSRPCFGYNVVDSRFVINEEEAEIVRKMVNWMLQGEGAHRVMRRLNDMGVKTKDGKSFTQLSVGKLMRRETIAGMFVYNRGYTLRGKSLIRPEEEWIVIENHHEPIIDKETFKRLQIAITARKTSGKQADNERWLLTGVVNCTHCGRPMFGRYRKKPSGKEYFHYVCSSYMKRAECFHHFIDRDLLENTVIDHLLNADKFNAKSEEINSNEPQIEINISNLKANLKKLDIKMQRQIELFEDAEINKEDFRIARDRIQDQRQKLEDQIKLAEKDTQVALEKEFVNRVGLMKNDLKSKNRSEQKNALRQLVKTVEVTNSSSIHIKVRL